MFVLCVCKDKRHPHPSRPALGPTQPPIQWGTGSFPGVKRPGRGVNHLSPPSAAVKVRVELYFYAPSGPSWPLVGRTLLSFLLSSLQCSSFRI